MAESAFNRVPMHIDFVSDVVCPWCAIGLASLLKALQTLQNTIDARIQFHPFELNPDMPAEGERIADHLQRKYGLSSAQLAENQARIHARGAELGFPFDTTRDRFIYNTFDAHRLLHWAGVTGGQLALKQAFLAGYFIHSANIADHEALLRLVADAGLSVEDARGVLQRGDYAAEVRADAQFYRDQGIQSVPAIIINQKHLISGGQPVEVFQQLLMQIATRG